MPRFFTSQCIRDYMFHPGQLLRGLVHKRKKNIWLTLNPRLVSADAGGAKQNYYFTSERGIHAIRDGKIYRLTRNKGYGLAFYKEDVYCSIDLGYFSCVVRFPKHCLSTTVKIRINAEVLYGRLLHDSRGRIHQVTAGSHGRIWIANTSRNTLVMLNSGATPPSYAEVAPLVDHFSSPILCDHNHLNSVVDYGDFQLFSAFRAGNGALIGLIRDGHVTGFHYPHSGIHDLFLTATGFILCDMLGSPEIPGNIITERGAGNAEIIALAKHYAVRGVSIYGDEMLLGLSCKNQDHTLRMQEPARLLMQNATGVTTCLVPSCSQVYQMIHESGESCTPVPHSTAAEVYNMFEKSFGSPIYQGKLASIR